MKIVVLTAPSGSGKTTIARRVQEEIPALRFSVSATTRPPRSGEQEGVDYYFMNREAFLERVAAGDMLEYEEFYSGRLYGTLRAEVDRLGAAHPVLLDIEVKGAANIKRLYGPEALVIFIQPPSFEILRERLIQRRTEDAQTLHDRLERARMELTYAGRFDAVVVNDDLEEAVAEATRLIRSFLEAQPHA